MWEPIVQAKGESRGTGLARASSNGGAAAQHKLESSEPRSLTLPSQRSGMCQCPICTRFRRSLS